MKSNTMYEKTMKCPAAPHRLYRPVKRAFDVFFSFLFLLILSPLLAVVALCILIDDGAPVIHKRVCIGKNKTYTIFKFRSMKKDADCLENWFSPQQMKEYKKEFKIDNDPRITRLGKKLRKTSLDELPQLFSILKGDMSFVGPRPIVESELSFYGEDTDIFVSAKPGLTGFWQVNGRSNCTYESGERQKMELYYIRKRSLGLDLKILLKTVKVVLTGEGAR